MDKLYFEDRAVAFIDVLGFSSFVNEACNANVALVKLQGLFDLLNNAIPTLDKSVSEAVPNELIPKHICISDSIILSAPLRTSLQGWSQYSGLDVIIMRAIQLTHMLLNSGYLIRGGISIGKVCHIDNNIVGSAYQDAYKLESKACMPRIILSAEAEQYWKSNNGLSRCCLEYDSVFMVNGLFDYYTQGVNNYDIASLFDNYIEIATDNVNKHTVDNVSKKWSWFLDYIKNEYKHAVNWSNILKKQDIVCEL